jgi:hypothetical protein
METIEGLADLAALVRNGGGNELYVRWSLGPDSDLGDRAQASRDALTGVELPGLSANSLRPEPWWGDRSLEIWVARKLYDYHDMRRLRGPDVRPWVLAGEECGTGPDNEPLVICHSPVAWVSETALRQCRHLIDRQDSEEWGPLHRAD